MMKFSNVDDGEIEKFDRLSAFWWDPRGIMGSLHAINPLRIRFILSGFEMSSPRILDVGCGGGILSEGLAQAGARVLGIDLSEASLQVARAHALRQGLSVDYRLEAVESIAREFPGAFDAVTCMEMLEHVPDPKSIVEACARLLKPGGHFFCATINRTPKAFLFAIIGGEYLLRLLPRHSHTYARLISPQELTDWARQSGLEFARLSSLLYNPFTRKFTVVAGKADVNYMAHFTKG